MSSLSLKIWLAIWTAILAAVYFTSDGGREDTKRENVSKKKIVNEGKELKVLHPCKKKADDDYKLLLTELKLAENYMSANDQDEAICHFANAIVMSSDPLMFIDSLNRTLPLTAFNKLMEVLINTYGEDFRKQWETSNTVY